MQESPNKKPRKRLNSDVPEFIPSSQAQNDGNNHQTSIKSLIDLLVQLNTNYTFNHKFKRLNKYNDIRTIKNSFSPLERINNAFRKIEMYQNAYYFVMRSTTYDDIHKAMKYGVWTSTPNNNKKIDSLFKQAVKENRKVLLFYRVATENVLCGVAELTSGYIEEQQFDYWWNKIKWNGIFNLKWIYVKNLDLNVTTRKEGEKRLYELTDGCSLNPENGFFLLDMFKHINFKFEFSIFKFFELFDQREDYLRGVRCRMDVKIRLQKKELKPSNYEKKKFSLRKNSDTIALTKSNNQKRGSLMAMPKKPKEKRRHTFHFSPKKKKNSFDLDQEFQISRRYSHYVEPTNEEWEELGYVQKDEQINEYILK